MALWWEWSKYTLPSGKKIDDLKKAIADDTTNGLPSLGYTDIKVAGDEVHGQTKGDIIAVVYLPISGQDFWQVVSCAGSGPKEKVTTFLNALGILKELDL